MIRLIGGPLKVDGKGPFLANVGEFVAVVGLVVGHSLASNKAAIVEDQMGANPAGNFRGSHSLEAQRRHCVCCGDDEELICNRVDIRSRIQSSAFVSWKSGWWAKCWRNELKGNPLNEFVICGFLFLDYFFYLL